MHPHVLECGFLTDDLPRLPRGVPIGEAHVGLDARSDPVIARAVRHSRTRAFLAVGDSRRSLGAAFVSLRDCSVASRLASLPVKCL